ncbi:MAG: hypothetical protein HC793_02525 [Aquincola sp.]|nr:hypothetical protein [Aquincola sp.]
MTRNADTPVIPATYAQWRHCIEVECGIALDARYIAERLTILRQADHPETQRFATLYGQPHWRRVVGWFEQAGGANALVKPS